MADNIRQLNLEGQKKLAEAGIHDAVFDARALLSFVLEIPFSQMPLHYADHVTDEQQAEYVEVLEKRISGVPLQYITGEQEFMGLDFYVDERVLIPRLDTEILAEEAVRYVKELYRTSLSDQSPHGPAEICPGGVNVLDLCCGSGAIGLSIKVLSEGMSQMGDKDISEDASQISDDAVNKRDRVDGSRQKYVNLILSDISPDALCVARRNAEALGVIDDVKIIKSDLFEAIDEGVGEANGEGISREDFDLIVSNPPYIRSDVIETLDTEVRDHEPMLALDGGDDGLDIYRRIIEEAPDHLKAGGVLMMEIGADQAEDVAGLIEKTGKYVETQIKKDLAGLDRLVITKVQ